MYMMYTKQNICNPPLEGHARKVIELGPDTIHDSIDYGVLFRKALGFVFHDIGSYQWGVVGQ